MADRGRWTLSAESITAAAAVVAALIALAVGVWENIQQRRHNRLSVSPSLEIVAELRTDNSEQADSVDRALIRLTNEGVGPAIVDGIRIRVRSPEGTVRSYRDWSEAVAALEQWGVQVTTRTQLGEGAVVGVGRSYELVAFEAEPEAQDQMETFITLLDQIGIAVTYHSIYGDEFRSTYGEETEQDAAR